MKFFVILYKKKKNGGVYMYDHIVKAESEQAAREVWKKKEDELVELGQHNRFIIEKIVEL